MTDVDFSVFEYDSWRNGKPRDTVAGDRITFFEWNDAAAVYVDGKLKDSHHPAEMTELVLRLVGIRVIQDNSFMMGQDSWAGVAPSINHAAKFAVSLREKADRAKRLRDQAAALIAEADELEE